MEINADDVKHALKAYNEAADGEYVFNERTAAAVFAPPYAQEKIPLYVMTVNALFGTYLQREPGTYFRVCRSLDENWAAFAAFLARVATYPEKWWKADDARGPAAAVRGTQTFSLILPPTVTNHYGFATKLLHWFRPDYLPPVDKYAAAGAARLGAESRVWLPTYKMDYAEMVATNAEKYCDVILLYRDVLAALADHEEELIAYDLATQAERHRTPNTFVRVVDKFLRVKGMEKAEAAAPRPRGRPRKTPLSPEAPAPAPAAPFIRLRKKPPAPPEEAVPAEAPVDELRPEPAIEPIPEASAEPTLEPTAEPAEERTEEVPPKPREPWLEPPPE